MQILCDVGRKGSISRSEAANDHLLEHPVSLLASLSNFNPLPLVHHGIKHPVCSPFINKMVGQGQGAAVSHVKPQLSTFETFHLYALIVYLLLIKIIPPLLVEVIRKRDLTPTSLQRAFVRHIGSYSPSIPLRLSRHLQLPTGETIVNTCQQKVLQHDSVQLFAGEFPPAILHFIGCPSTQSGPMLLYFHGGGYVFPMTAGQFAMAQLAAKASGANLAVLEYKLAPELRYPGQLAQAAAALRFLLHDHKASDILIGGDSAGGNITLALLAHLQSPHRDVQPVITEPSQPPPILRGAFCISPRCSNATTSPSFTSNAPLDIVSAKSMDLFTSCWQPAADEVWASPIRGDRQFWSTLSAKRLLIVAGADEVYRDDITEFAGLVGAESSQQGAVERQFTICPGEIHDQAILDLGIHVDTGGMLTAVLQWLRNSP